MVFFFKSDIFSFLAREAEPIGSANESQCLYLLRGSSQCLPYEVPCLGPSAPPHKCSAEQGIRFWQHSWDFGGHSTVDNSTQPPRQDSAGLLSRPSLPGLLVWVAEGEECSILALPRRRYGLERVPPGMGLGVAIVPGQAVPTEGGRRFVCVRGMCMLKDMARPGVSRKLLPFKRACIWLALQSLCSWVFLPVLFAARQGLI